MCFVVESVAATGDGCRVRGELGCQAFGCDVQGSLGSGMCPQEGICLGGAGWPLLVPHGLSQAAREPGSEPSCEGVGDLSSVQRVAVQTPASAGAEGP